MLVMVYLFDIKLRTKVKPNFLVIFFYNETSVDGLSEGLAVVASVDGEIWVDASVDKLVEASVDKLVKASVDKLVEVSVDEPTGTSVDVVIEASVDGLSEGLAVVVSVDEATVVVVVSVDGVVELVGVLVVEFEGEGLKHLHIPKTIACFEQL